MRASVCCSWQAKDAPAGAVAARRQQLIAMKAMSPSELDEWNRLQAVRRAAAGDVSTDAVHVEHITGADAVALVG